MFFGGPQEHEAYQPSCTDNCIEGATGLVSCADLHEHQTFVDHTNQGGSWRHEELSEPNTFIEEPGAAGLLPRFF